MDVILQDMESESTESLDQLLKIITVWRQRLTNMSNAVTAEEVVCQLEYLKEVDAYHGLLINQSISFVESITVFYLDQST